MNGYFQKINKLFNELKKKQAEINDLVRINEIKSKELQEQCKRTSMLQEELMKSTQDDSVLSSQYLSLREQNDFLMKEIGDWKSKFVSLEQQLRANIEKLNVTESHCKIREEELHNDFQLTQAAIMLENDAAQAKLRSQVEEGNRRNRELTATCVGLREEFYGVKQSYNQKIVELQQRLHSAEEKLKHLDNHRQNQTNHVHPLHITPANFPNKFPPLNISTNKTLDIVPSNTDSLNKALDVSSNSNISLNKSVDVSSEKIVQDSVVNTPTKKIFAKADSSENVTVLNYSLNKPFSSNLSSPESVKSFNSFARRSVPIFTGTGKKTIISRRNSSPVKNCDSTIPVKKRKLYNPNSLDYLDN